MLMHPPASVSISRIDMPSLSRGPAAEWRSTSAAVTVGIVMVLWRSLRNPYAKMNRLGGFVHSHDPVSLRSGARQARGQCLSNVQILRTA
ncbi:hypothetical protein OH77DRAFT_1421335 [Trametes cingulata]|nr:hypothetical protein OH77DRAFT_1421335 [Trametes cingulata]